MWRRPRCHHDPDGKEGALLNHACSFHSPGVSGSVWPARTGTAQALRLEVQLPDRELVELSYTDTGNAPAAGDHSPAVGGAVPQRAADAVAAGLWPSSAIGSGCLRGRARPAGPAARSGGGT